MLSVYECLKQMDDAQGVNPDLDRERQKANIDVESVSLVLYGDLLQKKRAAGLFLFIYFYLFIIIIIYFFLLLMKAFKLSDYMLW